MSSVRHDPAQRRRGRLAPTCALLALLVARAAAAETGAASGPTLHWPGGALSAAEAVAWLAASGNETRLDPGVRERRARPDFITGSYWQAVLAVCQAYGLGLSSQVASTSGHGPEDAPERFVIVEHGPLLLVPAMPDGEAQPALTARQQTVCGPLLLSLADAGVVAAAGAERGEFQARFRLRLEPRLTQGEQLRQALLRVHLLAGADGRVAPWSVPHGPWDGQPARLLGFAARSPDAEGWNRLRAPGVPADARGLLLEGSLLLAGSRSQDASGRAAVPGAATLDLEGETLAVELAPSPDGGSILVQARVAVGDAQQLRLHLRSERGRRRPVTVEVYEQQEGRLLLKGHCPLPPGPVVVEARRERAQPLPLLPWRLAIDLP